MKSNTIRKLDSNGGQPKIVVNGIVIQRGKPMWIPEVIADPVPEEPIITEDDFVQPITINKPVVTLLSKIRSFFGWPLQ